MPPSIPSLDAFYASLHLLHELQDAVARWRSAISVPHYNCHIHSTTSSAGGILPVFHFMHALKMLAHQLDEVRMNIQSGALGSGTSFRRAGAEYSGYEGESTLWKKSFATLDYAYQHDRDGTLTVQQPSGEDPEQYIPQIDMLLQKLKFELSHVPTFIDGSNEIQQVRSDVRRLATKWKKLKNLR